jgi:hypothetical protein
MLESLNGTQGFKAIKKIWVKIKAIRIIRPQILHTGNLTFHVPACLHKALFPAQVFLSSLSMCNLTDSRATSPLSANLISEYSIVDSAARLVP